VRSSCTISFKLSFQKTATAHLKFTTSGGASWPRYLMKWFMSGFGGIRGAAEADHGEAGVNAGAGI
jgi:hypothetical protein